ncbi:MAG: hypothetical protein ABJF01_03790 [bacterium]
MSSGQHPEFLGVMLNANQRRHYGILLTGLETALAKIEAAITDGPRASALGTVSSDLPAVFRDGAHPILQSIRDNIQRLATGLALETHPLSQRQTCRALLTSEINRIEESYSSHLRGYGAVDESVGASLDPVLRGMRTELGELVALLSVRRD